VSRLLGLALLAGVLVLAGATPAAAHAGGAEPGNWLAVLDEVSPAMPGVTVRLLDRGEQVELANAGPEVVTVLGYDGEPYLRIGPAGVAGNARSAATYLNRSRDAHAPVPDSARDPAAPPQWQPLSPQPVWRWHDHRTHWMQDDLPPSVVDRPNGTDTVEVARFQLDFRHGDTPATVSGRLLWVAPPPLWPWAAGGVLLLATGILAGGLRRWRPAAAALLGVLLATDLAHAVAEGAVAGALPSAAGWALGLLSLAGLARSRGWAPYTLAMTGVLLAVVDGLGDVSTLLHSQLPGAGPAGLARAACTVALGLGLGLLGTGWRVWRRQHPLPVPQPVGAPARR
jgi:hypothetical protein